MKRIEIRGPGLHDGTRLEVPDGIEAVAVFSRDADGDLHVTLAVADVDGMDLDELKGAVVMLACNLEGDTDEL